MFCLSIIELSEGERWGGSEEEGEGEEGGMALVHHQWAEDEEGMKIYLFLKQAPMFPLRCR